MINKWDKTIENALKKLFPESSMDERFGRFINLDGGKLYFSYQHVRIAGDETLRASLGVYIDTVEAPWLKYLDELKMSSNVKYTTAHVNIANTGIAGDGLLVITGLRKPDIDIKIEEIFKDLFMPKALKYFDLKYADSVFNKDIEITDEINNLSAQDGLPFRKMILAQLVDNPKQSEIKQAMLEHCEQCRQTGLKHNYEPLMHLKTVFIKMFGQ